LRARRGLVPGPRRFGEKLRLQFLLPPAEVGLVRLEVPERVPPDVGGDQVPGAPARVEVDGIVVAGASSGVGAAESGGCDGGAPSEPA
jgi:hypothetical protein